VLARARVWTGRRTNLQTGRPEFNKIVSCFVRPQILIVGRIAPTSSPNPPIPHRSPIRSLSCTSWKRRASFAAPPGTRTVTSTDFYQSTRISDLQPCSLTPAFAFHFRAQHNLGASTKSRRRRDLDIAHLPLLSASGFSGDTALKRVLRRRRRPYRLLARKTEPSCRVARLYEYTCANPVEVAIAKSPRSATSASPPTSLYH